MGGKSIWIVRFNKSIVWPDGLKSNLVSIRGSYEEALPDPAAVDGLGSVSSPQDSVKGEGETV